MGRYKVTYQSSRSERKNWRSREFGSLPEAHSFIEIAMPDLWELSYFGYIPKLEEYQSVEIGSKLPEKDMVSEEWIPTETWDTTFMSDSDKDYYNETVKSRKILKDLGIGREKVSKLIEEVRKED
jgi:hypothetical protein